MCKVFVIDIRCIWLIISVLRSVCVSRINLLEYNQFYNFVYRLYIFFSNHNPIKYDS